MKKLLAAIVTLGVVVGSLVGMSAPAAAAPTGFSIEPLPFTGLTEPSAVEFASTGQVFVAERRGVIDVYDNLDDASPRVAADLRFRVFNGGDRGLLGMALDPLYPTRPFLWALYAKDADVGSAPQKFGSGLTDSDLCGDSDANNCRISGELARLTIDPATGVWTGEEKVLLNDWCQQFGSHSIGTVAFGTDGYLYVGAGDGGNYNQVDTGSTGVAAQRCSDPAGTGGALRAQAVRRAASDPMVLNGAILRLDPDTGLAAPGNPYASDANPLKQRVLAYGLRNPYRFAPRPGTNEIWVGDVGWTDWEELDRIVVDNVAENFGWPCYEGPGRQAGYDSANVALCETLYAQGDTAVASPLLSYNHGNQLGGPDHVDDDVGMGAPHGTQQLAEHPHEGAHRRPLLCSLCDGRLRKPSGRLPLDRRHGSSGECDGGHRCQRLDPSGRHVRRHHDAHVRQRDASGHASATGSSSSEHRAAADRRQRDLG
jgi:glucose/arabinose dehydrogenase